jgi:hypothetical protein
MKKNSLLFVLIALIMNTFSQNEPTSTFIEREIILKTATGDIYGTLTMPADSKTFPLVLIIAGSGPTDRNGNSAMGLTCNAYQMMAHGLANEGIGSVRFDKRGIGASKNAMGSESELRFETYVQDVVAWIRLLENDKRFKEIYILGHSEGSLIGILAAQQTKIEGYISVAGPGKSSDKILQEQLKDKLPIYLIATTNQIIDSLKVGKTVEKVDPNLMSMFRPSIQPYMISWFKYDPSIEIGKLKGDVLIVQGTTDLQVKTEEAYLLSKGNPKAKLVILDNMNHVLKESSLDTKENMGTYNNPTLPLKAGFLEAIIKFIL